MVARGQFRPQHMRSAKGSLERFKSKSASRRYFALGYPMFPILPTCPVVSIQLSLLKGHNKKCSCPSVINNPSSNGPYFLTDMLNAEYEGNSVKGHSTMAVDLNRHMEILPFLSFSLGVQSQATPSTFHPHGVQLDQRALTTLQHKLKVQ